MNPFINTAKGISTNPSKHIEHLISTFRITEYQAMGIEAIVRSIPVLIIGSVNGNTCEDFASVIIAAMANGDKEIISKLTDAFTYGVNTQTAELEAYRLHLQLQASTPKS